MYDDIFRQARSKIGSQPNCAGKEAPMYKRVILERSVAIPMRDGTLTYADIFRPDTDNRVPAILSRTPYSKESLLNHTLTIDAFRAAEHGFAVVFQDTRGRWASQGEFYPFRDEITDGYDSVEWLAAQPWCSGPVGMTGGSYIGATQWLAALAQPPHLKAIVPIITSAEYYEGWMYQGGAFQLGAMLFWAAIHLATDTARRKGMMDEMTRLLLAGDTLATYFQQMPLKTLPLLKDTHLADYYFDWLDHETNDDYWQAIAINRNYTKVQVPAYNIGGWYDLFLSGTLENFARMRREAGTEAARAGTRLLIGPWSHGVFSGTFSEASFGAFSGQEAIDHTGLQLRFFDYHLAGKPNGRAEEPPVRLFIMGANVWRGEQEWPLARTQFTPWYLHSDGHASSIGGGLSPIGPADEPADVYLYNPHDPAPTIGGPTFLPGLDIGVNAGPRTQRSVEVRPDVLTFTSDALQQPLEVIGPLTAVLYAATSARDTDFVVRLCDVYPDGRSYLLAEGIIRARYRNGTDHAEPIKAGEITEYRIDLVATGNVFLAGHSIRVVVTSSSFPRFDRNPNTGHCLGEDSVADMVPAVQTIYHDSNYPSHVILPIISFGTR
jgi:putative CocE/NonD family hydrolase